MMTVQSSVASQKEGRASDDVESAFLPRSHRNSV
jgi:hypothetical protein